MMNLEHIQDTREKIKPITEDLTRGLDPDRAAYVRIETLEAAVAVRRGAQCRRTADAMCARCVDFSPDKPICDRMRDLGIPLPLERHLRVADL